MHSCKIYRKKHDIRLTFHLDQFVVLSLTRAEVVKNSLLELKYQTELADLVGADVINVHGSAYGNKKQVTVEVKQKLRISCAKTEK
ncbi:MAG: damage endonuclease [Candidatus Cloacimonadota bacterium]|nr:damage endonuclease [Candidatus Cloacimonadota bacterium]